jgi:8-oxo-dGTP diphosphatase
MKLHISSGAIVFKKEKNIPKILILKRKKGPTYHLPKGTKRIGENLKQTAIREVQEETGYKIKILKYLGWLPSTATKKGQKFKKRTHYFLAKGINKIRPKDYEHDQVLWTLPENALKLLEQRVKCYENETLILKKALNKLSNK